MNCGVHSCHAVLGNESGVQAQGLLDPINEQIVLRKNKIIPLIDKKSGLASKPQL